MGRGLVSNDEVSAEQRIRIQFQNQGSEVVGNFGEADMEEEKEPSRKGESERGQGRKGRKTLQ